MSTLNAAITASASAPQRRAHAHRSRRCRTWPTPSPHARPDGQPYRRRDVVLATDPVNSFDGVLGQRRRRGVKVAGVVEDQTPFRRRYEPSHPDADADGFVSLPNVDRRRRWSTCSAPRARTRPTSPPSH